MMHRSNTNLTMCQNQLTDYLLRDLVENFYLSLFPIYCRHNVEIGNTNDVLDYERKLICTVRQSLCGRVHFDIIRNVPVQQSYVDTISISVQLLVAILVSMIYHQFWLYEYNLHVSC